nr:hypothetical protein CFP56_37060 [Quercus suber]
MSSTSRQCFEYAGSQLRKSRQRPASTDCCRVHPRKAKTVRLAKAADSARLQYTRHHRQCKKYFACQGQCVTATEEYNPLAYEMPLSNPGRPAARAEILKFTCLSERPPQRVQRCRVSACLAEAARLGQTSCRLAHKTKLSTHADSLRLYRGRGHLIVHAHVGECSPGGDVYFRSMVGPARHSPPAYDSVGPTLSEEEW